MFLAYDNAVRQQKLRTEISQAKREADHYLQSIDHSKAKRAILERKKKAGKLIGKVSTSTLIIKVIINYDSQGITHTVKQRRFKETSQTDNTSIGGGLSDKLLRKV